MDIQQTPSLFVATPMYGGMCTGAYLQGMLQLTDMCRQLGWPTSVSMIYNESLITRGRNVLVHQFLKSPCTHLFFVDADIRFNAGDVKPMVEANKEVVCGIYPKKEINWGQVRHAMSLNVPDDQLRHHTGSFVVNLVNYQGTVTVPVNEPVEVWEAGTGFMLIKREVFEKMAPHCPVYLNDVLGSAGQMEPITEFFATSIDPVTRRLLSEDYHFCHTWRNKCGGKVYAAPWATLAHIGTYVFEGQMVRSDPVPAPALEKKAEAAKPRPKSATAKKKVRASARARPQSKSKPARRK